MPLETPRCRGVNGEGEPCKAPPRLVDSERGYCRNHDPELADARQAQALKGAMKVRLEAQKRRKALDPAELPPLDSHERAEEWCELVASATARGVLPANRAQAILRAVSEWRQCRDAGAVSARLKELTDALAEWKKTGSPDSVLELMQ